ncbi:outer membrane protein OmpA-like peptidoglycan-associated protein [Pedobacter psychrotolerans]|nr:OmpA family protein [Pedobacter psychrotolerans]TCO30715.1 outer membrane protein OmpA-like peptidoglycan-associated protein [Pedobacter psychrotolerans]
MKKLLLLILFLTAFILTTKPVLAQYVLNAADKQYKLFNYINAIDLYEQAYNKKKTLYAAEQLGKCYHFIKDYKQTESWYAIAAGMPETSADNVLQYAKALQQNMKYTEAKEQYQKYASTNKQVTSVQLKLWEVSCDSALLWMKKPTGIVIDNEKKLNTAQSDWGAHLYQNSVVFASDRGGVIEDKQNVHRPFLKFDGSKKPDRNIYGWTGNRYLRLFIEDKNKDSVSVLPVNAGTEYHIGPASFTADGNEMYFTLTKIPKKPKYGKDGIATLNLEIYSCKKDSTGKWTVPTPFKYNNAEAYSNGDPFISADGNSLYFVSSMPNGMGGTDIYVSRKTKAGDWDTPENLKGLNTEGNERTPVLDQQGNFFFSSDGRIGMGGLDIFTAKILNGKNAEPVNLHYPINSSQDDFAYIKSNDQTGYLSSNRTDGIGSDDIYSFVPKQVIALWLVGKVMDRNSKKPLAHAIVTLKKINGQVLKVETDETGDFKFNLDQASDYNLTGDKTGYRGDASSLTTHNLNVSAEIRRDLYLEQIIIDKPIRIENIYYDFDKSNIRPDAAIELDKLVKIMHDNPTIWIELGSHTDSRGNDQYNQWLSQSRANSAVQYIIDRGINKNRITAKGYGESMLLNQCSNGVKCSEADHQLNRRTEFKITKF